MTPWRSREYLDLSYVEGKTCVRCGRLGCEPCHYSGLYSDRLGKGGAQKSMDAAVADLCRECHVYFDLYKGGNDDARAAEFLLLCLVTLHRNLQEHWVVIVPFMLVREPPPEMDNGGSVIDPTKRLTPDDCHDDKPPSKRATKQKGRRGSKRGTHCQRPDKVLPRGNRIV